MQLRVVARHRHVVEEQAALGGTAHRDDGGLRIELETGPLLRTAQHDQDRVTGSEAPDAEAPEAEEGPGLLARIQAFWDERREGAEPERSPDDEIVTCDLGGDTTFTYHSDCLSRGGRIR